MPSTPLFQTMIGAILVTVFSGSSLMGQAEFLNRPSDDAVRVATYNLGGFIDDFSDSLFEFDFSAGEFRAVPSLERVFQAVDADVWAFQEMADRNSLDVRNALNAAVPLGNGQSWFAFQRSSQIIASRYPIVDPVFSVPGVPRSPTIASIDLPDDQYDRDLHLINLHLDAGSRSSDRFNRQFEGDRIVDYLRDTRDPTSSVALPFEQPVIVLGDLNDFDATNAVPTLITGDIINENVFGNDSPPDWDGTALLDPMPTQNGVVGGSLTTFQGSFFNSRLDFQFYTDAVMTHTNAFVLRTATMSSAALQAAGLLSNDTFFDPSTGLVDHLPVVVDYAITSAELLGDFDNDGDVDAEDVDFYLGSIGLPAIDGFQQFDLDGDELVTLADHQFHIENLVQTSNGQTGTCIGDLNLDGVVDVLGDGFTLIGNLGGNGPFRYANGNLNADFAIDVLGDAFLFIANLGKSN
jgi:endonuclease/exonuclease/phosphatase family metal-dependent hydrolase